MLLPIALVYDASGKLEFVRYFKFDAPIPYADKLGDRDYNEMTVYTPTQHVLLNTSVINVPVASIVAKGTKYLNYINGITRVLADGSIQDDHAQLIVPKYVDQNLLADLKDYYNDRYMSYSRLSPNHPKAIESEYQLSQLNVHPEECHFSTICANDGRSVLLKGTVCTAYAVDYTGKVFTMPLGSVMNLVLKHKLKVGNFYLGKETKKNTPLLNYRTQLMLVLKNNDYSTQKDTLDIQSAMAGSRRPMSEVYTADCAPADSQVVVIPEGIDNIRLDYERESYCPPSIICPKTVAAMLFKGTHCSLASFTSPEQVSTYYSLEASSIAHLTLPKRLYANSAFIRGGGFTLKLDKTNLDKIEFDYSSVGSYTINIKDANTLQGIRLPLARYASIDLSEAHNFKTLMLHRVDTNPVIKPIAEVGVSVATGEYVIDARLPLKYLHITFPDTVTKSRVLIRHCGISRLTYQSESPDNSIVLVPLVDGIGVSTTKPGIRSDYQYYNSIEVDTKFDIQESRYCRIQIIHKRAGT